MSAEVSEVTFRDREKNEFANRDSLLSEPNNSIEEDIEESLAELFNKKDEYLHWCNSYLSKVYA